MSSATGRCWRPRSSPSPSRCSAPTPGRRRRPRRAPRTGVCLEGKTHRIHPLRARIEWAAAVVMVVGAASLAVTGRARKRTSHAPAGTPPADHAALVAGVGPRAMTRIRRSGRGGAPRRRTVPASRVHVPTSGVDRHGCGVVSSVRRLADDDQTGTGATTRRKPGRSFARSSRATRPGSATCCTRMSRCGCRRSSSPTCWLRGREAVLRWYRRTAGSRRAYLHRVEEAAPAVWLAFGRMQLSEPERGMRDYQVVWMVALRNGLLWRASSHETEAQARAAVRSPRPSSRGFEVAAAARALGLGVDLGAEEQREARQPQPGEHDDHGRERAPGLVVGAEVRDVPGEPARHGQPDGQRDQSTGVTTRQLGCSRSGPKR